MHETATIAPQPQSTPAAAANEAAPLQERQLDAETDLVDRFPIQLKLAVGAPDDPLEHEADAMADKVMRMPETPFAQRDTSPAGDRDDEQVRLKPLVNQITPLVQRCNSCGDSDDEHIHLKPLTQQVTPFVQRCTSCGDRDDEHIQLKPLVRQVTPFAHHKSSCSCNDEYDDEHIQLKPLSDQVTPFIQCCATCGEYDDEHIHLKSLNDSAQATTQSKSEGLATVSDSVSSRITSTMGNGKPMDKDTKSFMESRFGADFGSVKIHDGEESAQLSRSLKAKAFTVRDNIYFNNGHYRPETESGKHLLAHELTHVVQQNSAIELKPETSQALNGKTQSTESSDQLVQRDINENAGNQANAPASTSVNNMPISAAPENSAGATTDTMPASPSSAGNTPVISTVASNSNGSSQAPAKGADGKPGVVSPVKVPAAQTPADPKAAGGSKAKGKTGEAPPKMEAPPLFATDNPGDILAVLQQTPVTEIAKAYNDAKGVAAQSQGMQKDESVKLIPVVPESNGSPYGGKNGAKKKFTANKESASAKNVYSGKGDWSPPPLTPVALPVAPAVVPSRLAVLPNTDKPNEVNAGQATNELDNVDFDESTLPDKLDDAPTVPLSGEADVNNVTAEEQAQLDEVAQKKALAAMEISNDFGENDVIPKPGKEEIKTKRRFRVNAGAASALNGGAPVQDELLANRINASAADHINTKIGEQTQKYAQEEIVYRGKITKGKTEADKQINDETLKSNQLQNKAQDDAQSQVGGLRVEWQKKLDDTETDFQTKAGDAANEHIGKINEESKKGNDEAKRHYDEANEEVAKKKAAAKKEAEDKKNDAKNESQGFWGWLADKASALIDSLKEAVHFIFDKLRAAVKWAFEQAKRLAMAAIELARTVVVGLIKAFGEVLKGFVDVAFAAFPEIRDEINGKIDQTVDAAVSVANQAFDTFKAVVAAVIDTFAEIVDTALAVVQKAYDIAFTVTKFVIVASLKIIDFLTNIQKQYELFKAMIDGFELIWNHPEILEDKAKEFLEPYIQEIPGSAQGAVEKALATAGLSVAKHLTGIMKYLTPTVNALIGDWWGQAKNMIWFLIWPFAKGSPLYEDAPKLWHLLPNIWDDFKAGDYSKMTDEGLEWMQALNNTVGAFAGWIAIGGAVIGAILGGIFGVGAGAIPGAGAGFEAGVAIGEGIMVSMIATETAVITKAIYDLSVTDDDGKESPVPPPEPKKVEKSDDSETKNEAPPSGQGAQKEGPHMYTAAQVKTGRDRILFAYQRIANSGLTLGIMLALFLLGAIGGKIAEALSAGLKKLGSILTEALPELTDALKGVGKGISESKPVQALKGVVKDIKESKAGQALKDAKGKFDEAGRG